jgi:hypothetical protein
MIDLKQKKILTLEDWKLQKYMQSGMIIECTEQYTLGALFEE